MPLFGVPDIDGLKAKHNINGLIKALNYRRKEHIRVEAAQALGELCDAYAVEPLVTAMDDDTENVGVAAAHALGQIRDANAVVSLIEALQHRHVGVRVAAAEALAQMGDGRAIGPLIALSASEHDQVRTAASKALVRLGAPTLQPLVQALTDTRTEVRQGAAATLKSMGPPAVQALTDALSHEQAEVRTAAAWGLEQVGWMPTQSAVSATYWIVKGQWEHCVTVGAAAVEPLIALLQDEDLEVRKVAVGTIIKIGPAAIDPLVANLHHETPEMRMALVWILGQIGDLRAVEPLLEMFKDVDPAVHRAVVAALARFGSRILDTLLASLHHEHGEIRWGATEVLDKIGWQPPSNETGASYWVVKEEWRKCIELGAVAVPSLIQTFTHWDPKVRECVLWTLTEIGAPAIDHLIVALNDEEKIIRMHAAEALGQIGDERAGPALTALLSTDDKEVSTSAYNAIVAIDKANVR